MALQKENIKKKNGRETQFRKKEKKIKKKR